MAGPWQQTMIICSDVEASSSFYCQLFGFESGHGGEEYEQLLLDGEIVMQLHDDKPDDAHSALADLSAPVGNGVLLWFEVEDFGAVVERARALDAPIDRDPHINPNAKQQECWILDPDGYRIVIAGPSEYRPRN